MEKPREPGSARFGNFINYYSFNPADRRISLLQDDLGDVLLKEKAESDVYVLDVGCNSGELTIALYNHLMKSLDSSVAWTAFQMAPGSSTPERKLHMLGVDIDSVLIKRSGEANPRPECITYQQADLMSEPDRLNVVQPWLSHISSHLCDLVTCFSVTMWIHLNHGDTGLREFLTYLSSIARHVIIEPQPWKCYKSALKRQKKLDCEPFKHYSSLTWRNDVDVQIVNFLQTDCRMQLISTLGETDWERKVCLFRKISS